MKICPYCESNLSETAKKCKFCWERIEKDEKTNKIEKNRKNYNKTTISLWNTLKILLILWIIIAVLSFFINIILYNWFDSEGIENIGVFLVLPEIIIYFVLIVLLIVRSVKSYKILLSTYDANLHFEKASTVWWWWIIPIIKWYRPCQSVKDILKNFELRSWIDRKCSIVWRWWAIWLIWSFRDRGYLYLHDETDLLMLNIITSLFSIISYFLLIKIIVRVNKAQRTIEQYLW